MIEMHLMPSKETDRKLRWATYVEEDETEFKLYIPKWRVPRPWPAVIRVSVREASGSLATCAPAQGSPGSNSRPCQARCRDGPLSPVRATRQPRDLGDRRALYPLLPAAV